MSSTFYEKVGGGLSSGNVIACIIVFLICLITLFIWLAANKLNSEGPYPPKENINDIWSNTVGKFVMIGTLVSLLLAGFYQLFGF